MPSAVYAPQLREKHEGEIGINGNPIAGVQAQGAFALGKNLGIQAQANYIGKNGANILGGLNYRVGLFPVDSQGYALLIGFSAGYSGGHYERYVTRAVAQAIPGVSTSPGFVLFDMAARWHGGYFQYSIGTRFDKFSIYTGTRFQWLNCEKFNYETQFFSRDTSNNGAVIPGAVRTINPRHGFTTTADVYFGLSFGWRHFHFFAQTQIHYQYNAANLNDTYKKFGQGVGTVGFTYMFYPRKKK